MVLDLSFQSFLRVAFFTSCLKVPQKSSTCAHDKISVHNVWSLPIVKTALKCPPSNVMLKTNQNIAKNTEGSLYQSQQLPEPYFLVPKFLDFLRSEGRVSHQQFLIIVQYSTEEFSDTSFLAFFSSNHYLKRKEESSGAGLLRTSFSQRGFDLF